MTSGGFQSFILSYSCTIYYSTVGGANALLKLANSDAEERARVTGRVAAVLLGN